MKKLRFTLKRQRGLMIVLTALVLSLVSLCIVSAPSSRVESTLALTPGSNSLPASAAVPESGFASRAVEASALDPQPLQGQAPAWSKGWQSLPITYEGCLARAQQALRLEGYSAERGGDNVYFGYKGIHVGVISCDPAPNGRTYANIFVASSSNDRNASGGERVRLQAQMERSGAGGCGELRVIRANYGEQGKFNDVTQLLQSQVRGGKLNVAVSNDAMGGDPNFGVVKKLYIRYDCGGRVFDKTINEGDTLSIP